MSDNKKTVDSVEKYREERKKQLAKAKKVKAGKGVKPKTKRLIGKVIGCIIAVAVLLGIVFLVCYSAGVPQRMSTVLKVGDQKISAAEYNYFYKTSIESFLNQYSNMLEYMGLDTEKPYDEQVYDQENNLTWADFFHQQTMQAVKEIVGLCQEAEKEGYKISEEEEKTADSNIESIKDYCKQQGITLGRYFTVTYGKGTNKSVVKDVLNMYILSNSFSNYKYDSFKPEDTEINTYYEENKDNFDTVNYRSIVCSGSIEAAEGEELTDEQKAQNKEEAKAKADEFLAGITNEASFNELAKNQASEEDKAKYDDPDATLTTEATKSTVTQTSEDLANWLFDSGRKAGDKEIVEVGDQYYVLYFVSRGRNDYNTVDVRHILVQFATTTDEEGNTQDPTDEAKATAKTTAGEIFNSWKNGEMTEESFAALATEKSDDGGSASNGGLYEQVYKGQMVDAFNNWIFDESRKAGDTGIVETSYGYHIMYYVGQNIPYWQVQVSNTISSNGYNEFVTSITDALTVEENSGNLKLTAYGGK